MTFPEFLNTPPTPPPGMGLPVPGMTDMAGQAVEDVQARQDRVTGADQFPMIKPADLTHVELPAGHITDDGRLCPIAEVRELTGWDEEKLARVDIAKNPSHFVTEMLLLGVQSLGDGQVSREQLLNLLTGDRNALVLGIRRATYGDNIEFELTCTQCDTKSLVAIELDVDVEVVRLDNPSIRQFDVELRNGKAKVQFPNGVVEEALSGLVNKRTVPELNSVLLSHCVTEIDGAPVFKNDAMIKGLSAGDRATLVEFISGKQPGPKLGNVQVSCATCGQEYPYTLSIATLFRV